MASKIETAKELLDYAKANLQSALKMFAALQKISEKSGGDLLGPKKQEGKDVAQYLFATATIALAYSALKKGKSKVQTAYNEYCYKYPELADRLYNENAAVARLVLQLELIMDYASSANLPDPYASDGIDIGHIAKDLSENSDKVTDLISTVDKLLAL